MLEDIDYISAVNPNLGYFGDEIDSRYSFKIGDYLYWNEIIDTQDKPFYITHFYKIQKITKKTVVISKNVNGLKITKVLKKDTVNYDEEQTYILKTKGMIFIKYLIKEEMDIILRLI